MGDDYIVVVGSGDFGSVEGVGEEFKGEFFIWSRMRVRASLKRLCTSRRVVVGSLL